MTKKTKQTHTHKTCAFRKYIDDDNNDEQNNDEKPNKFPFFTFIKTIIENVWDIFDKTQIMTILINRKTN